MLLLGVSATQHWESVQLIYEPIYHGSLHHRLHIMGSAIPLLKKLLILEQICDALLFLHSKELLHCSVSSHAVHLVSRGRAKLGCLETLIEDNNSSKRLEKKTVIYVHMLIILPFPGCIVKFRLLIGNGWHRGWHQNVPVASLCVLCPMCIRFAVLFGRHVLRNYLGHTLTVKRLTACGRKKVATIHECFRLDLPSLFMLGVSSIWAFNRNCPSDVKLICRKFI